MYGRRGWGAEASAPLGCSEAERGGLRPAHSASAILAQPLPYGDRSDQFLRFCEHWEIVATHCCSLKSINMIRSITSVPELVAAIPAQFSIRLHRPAQDAPTPS